MPRLQGGVPYEAGAPGARSVETAPVESVERVVEGEPGVNAERWRSEFVQVGLSCAREAEVVLYYAAYEYVESYLCVKLYVLCFRRRSSEERQGLAILKLYCTVIILLLLLYYYYIIIILLLYYHYIMVPYCF